MEDAHINELDFDDEKECSIFGVLDGHGGKYKYYNNTNYINRYDKIFLFSQLR